MYVLFYLNKDKTIDDLIRIKFYICIADNSDLPFLVKVLNGVKDWKALGRNIGVQEDLLKALAEADSSQEEAVKQVLTVWLDKECPGIASREILRRTLEDMNETDIAKLL